jgi:hypothetical protein
MPCDLTASYSLPANAAAATAAADNDSPVLAVFLVYSLPVDAEAAGVGWKH